MPILSKNNKKIFFIHIPRTSGRHVRGIFVKNGYIPFFNEYNETLFGFEIPHLWYPLYNFLPVSDMKHFTVVRNPLDRFKSCAKVFLWKHGLDEDYFLKEEFTLERFHLFLKETTDDKSTYFLPQSMFVTEKTYVWKQEGGFGKEFSQWCKESFDVNLKIDKNFHTYEKQTFDFINPKISTNNIEVIKKFYEEDYKIFGYEL